MKNLKLIYLLQVIALFFKLIEHEYFLAISMYLVQIWDQVNEFLSNKYSKNYKYYVIENEYMYTTI